MIKNISNTILGTMLLTGVASAQELYSNNGVSFTNDLKLTASVYHDNYSFSQRDNNGKGSAVLEQDVWIDWDMYGSKKITDTLTAGFVFKTDIAPMGYAYSVGADPNKVDKFSVDKAYLTLESTKGDLLEAGRTQGLYSKVTEVSDVDLWVGIPAMAPVKEGFFGTNRATAVQYSKTISKLTLAASFNAGANKDPLAVTTIGGDTVNLYRDAGYGASAIYNITDEVSVGAVYQGVYYRVENSNISRQDANLDDRNAANIVAASIKYQKGVTIFGLSANYKNYKFSDRISTEETMNDVGIEAGMTYDFKGDSVGFMPNLQVDYLRTQHKAGSEEINMNSVLCAEIGFQYFLSPEFAYQAAAIIDFRDKDDIEKTDGNRIRHNFFVVGVHYQF